MFGDNSHVAAEDATGTLSKSPADRQLSHELPYQNTACQDMREESFARSLFMTRYFLVFEFS